MMNALARMPKYDEYKNSGVDWIGDIPSHWEVQRFKFLASITTGARNTEDKQETGKYPFYVRSQKPERINSYSFDGEAILTAGDGAGVGKVYHYVNGKFDFHQRVYKFSDFSKVIGEYLFNYLYVNFYNVAILGTAKSTVDSLRLPLIQDFMICFPVSTTEQKKITSFLEQKTTQINEAIAIKEKQIALLKERRQIIIQKAVTQGLNSDVPMKDSGVDWIGQIPEHWDVVKLKLLANKIVDGAHFTPTYVDKGVPFLRVTDLSKMKDGLINWDNVRFIPEKEHKELIKRAKGEIGDVLISKNGTIGLTKVIDWDKQFSFFVSLCLIKLKAAISPHYFTSFFNSPIVDMQIAYGSSRTSVTNLHLEKIKELLVVLPPLNEQLAIDDYISSISIGLDQAIDTQTNQIENLKEYKATLINSAVTGKIKVA